MGPGRRGVSCAPLYSANMQPGPGFNISDSLWEDTFHSHDVWNVQRNVQLITNASRLKVVKLMGGINVGSDGCDDLFWGQKMAFSHRLKDKARDESVTHPCFVTSPPPPHPLERREEEEEVPTGVSSPDYKNKIFRDPAQINIFSHSFVILSPMTKWQIPELSPEHFVTLREEDTSRNNLICNKYENIFTIYMFLLFSPYHDCGTTDVRLYLVMSQCLSRLKIYENIVVLLLCYFTNSNQQRNIYLGSFLPLTLRSSSFGYLVNWGGMG